MSFHSIPFLYVTRLKKKKRLQGLFTKEKSYTASLLRNSKIHSREEAWIERLTCEEAQNLARKFAH
jgi:hypothetical protein